MWADLKIKAANGSVHSLHERETLALTTIQPPSRMEANVVMLGADNVGKSESVYNHSVTVAGRHVTFNIWDSPFAQDRLNSNCGKEKQIQWADGFVLVYSICDRASFNIVRQQIQLIKTMKDYPGTERAPIIIVGNKRDLCHCRTVSSEEGRLLALATHCGFCEISTAETYHGVLVAFHSLVDRIKESKMLTVRKPAGIKGIVRSMSAVFTRRRTDSL